MEIQLIKISDDDKRLLSDFYGEDLGNEIDFNRLMPVVEKIDTISNGTEIYSVYSIIRASNNVVISSGVRKTKIESVYKVAVDFIKWYNKQPKP